jgi:pyruvate-ferredoxin/flavodoxin oxidoreductase
MMDDRWPSYEMTYVDENGDDQKMTLPVTIADWAATETRFQKHFSKIKDPTEVDNLVPFDKYIDLPAAERDESTPFIYVLQENRTLGQLSVAEEIVRLAEDRLHIWSQLRQMAGLEVAPVVREAIQAEMEDEFSRRAEEIRTEYENKLAELKTSYPRIVARQMAEGLMRAGNGKQTLADLLSRVQAMPDLEPIGPDLSAGGMPAATTATVPSASAAPAQVEVAESSPTIAKEEEDEDDDELAMGPYIDSILCTTCDECTRINGKLFAYDDKKQAYIKDPNAGTFREIVMAAEKCPVLIIHPGTPLKPNERDLDKWIKRAEPFN